MYVPEFSDTNSDVRKQHDIDAANSINTRTLQLQFQMLQGLGRKVIKVFMSHYLVSVTRH